MSTLSQILAMPVPSVVLLFVLLTCLLLLLALLLRARPGETGRILNALESLGTAMEHSERALKDDIARNRTELAQMTRSQREELTGALHRFGENTQQRLDQIRAASEQAATALRQEVMETVRTLSDSLHSQLDSQGKRQTEQLDAFTRRVDSLGQTVDERLGQLRQDNEAKLEQMRKTVDEHLHGTLEKRLGESFKLVSERLEQVHKGLGEMQNLATGVGDLKRVLTNVKCRGTWGEVQLERLLDQIFSPGQYLKNVCTREDSRENVEFAVRVAGRDVDGTEMLLPIDSKCPVEDYERLLAALDANDMVQAEQSARQLEVRLKACAKDIRDKYLNPPRTTSYGVMFLPSEGLFAEALRRPGLVETLQREFRVVIAGPTTLAAILSSVQMGIAINQITRRSTEVWKILGAVKIEFRKYGEAVDKVRGSLNAAANNLERVSTRTRAIERKLKTVEELPEQEAQGLLAEVENADDNEDDVPALTKPARLARRTG